MLRFAQALQTLGLFLFVSIPTFVTAVAAPELNLSGDQFWVVLASRQDIDQAIAVARTNTSLKAMVVRSANGWFATINAPHTVNPGSGRQFLDGLARSQSIAKDAYLTKGAKFIAVIWTTPASPILDTMQYDGEHEAILQKGDLEIKLSKRLIGDGQSAPVADALYKGKPAFRTELTENPAEKPESQVALARLDPKSSMPQVVFTYFWQGAHYCTVTKIATLNNEGNWHVIDGGALDGDGYNFEDLDNAGFGYLVSVDQNFLYAFDSYAGSLAPTQIHQLVGDKLVDVTSDPKFQHRLLQSLYSEEDMAAHSDDVWHSNGFLAGWVASSMLVGKGREAWSSLITFAFQALRTQGGPIHTRFMLAFCAAATIRSIPLATPR